MIKYCKCGAISSVVESRDQSDRIMRRRYCTKCPEKWVTYEISRAEYKKLHEINDKRDTIKELAKLI